MSDKTEQEIKTGLTQYDIINNLIDKLDNTHYRNFELGLNNSWQDRDVQIKLKDLELEKAKAERDLNDKMLQFKRYREDATKKADNLKEELEQLKKENKELKAEVRKLEIELGL